MRPNKAARPFGLSRPVYLINARTDPAPAGGKAKSCEQSGRARKGFGPASSEGQGEVQRETWAVTRCNYYDKISSIFAPIVITAEPRPAPARSACDKMRPFNDGPSHRAPS
jgi:hypothetical protein